MKFYNGLSIQKNAFLLLIPIYLNSYFLIDLLTPLFLLLIIIRNQINKKILYVVFLFILPISISLIYEWANEQASENSLKLLFLVLQGLILKDLIYKYIYEQSFLSITIFYFVSAYSLYTLGYNYEITLGYPFLPILILYYRNISNIFAIFYFLISSYIGSRIIAIAMILKIMKFNRFLLLTVLLISGYLFFSVDTSIISDGGSLSNQKRIISLIVSRSEVVDNFYFGSTIDKWQERLFAESFIGFYDNYEPHGFFEYYFVETGVLFNIPLLIYIAFLRLNINSYEILFFIILALVQPFSSFARIAYTLVLARIFFEIEKK